MNNELTGVVDLYSMAYRKLRDNFWYYTKTHLLQGILFLAMIIVLVMIFVAAGSLFISADEVGGIKMFLLSIFGAAAVIIFLLWAGASMLSVFVTPDRKSIFQHLSHGWDRLFQFVAGLIMVNILVSIFSLLLVLPGIYMSIRYFFTQFAIMDPRSNLSASLAMDRSKELVDGRWWGVFFRMLAIQIPIFILSMLPQILLSSGAAKGIIGIIIGAFFLLICLLIGMFIPVYYTTLYESLTQQQPYDQQ